jgi:S1-C subfamily serine protease
MTNAHVVQGAHDASIEIYVKLNDQRRFKGKLVKFDRGLDLAIIKIDCV